MLSRRRFLLTAALAAGGLWAGAVPLWAAPRPRSHVVRAGETLGGIADRYDVTVAELKARNSLRDDLIRPGQRLAIPAPSVVAAVARATADLRIEAGRWRHVVAHHSAIEDGNAAVYDAAHRRRGMANGLAYHFVIGNGRDSAEGAIEVGPRWLRQLDGGHVRSQEFNRRGIGICLVGNFERRAPSERQLASLTALVDWLRADAPLGVRPRFTVHRNVDRNHTVCPGKNFPFTRYRLRYG
jgi:LysM repeat protein